jgi:hypothetical protein
LRQERRAAELVRAVARVGTAEAGDCQVAVDAELQRLPVLQSLLEVSVIRWY